MGCYAWSPAWRQLAVAIGFVSLGFTLSVPTSFAQSSRAGFCREYARDYSMRYSRGGIMGGVVRGALGGAVLEELWMAAEARAGAQEPARSLAAPRAEFKALRSSTGPMHVACAAAGRDALSDSSNGQKRINLPPARLINSISGAPTILPRDTQDAELAAGAGRETSAGIKFDRVVAVHR